MTYQEEKDKALATMAQRSAELVEQGKSWEEAGVSAFLEYTGTVISDLEKTVTKIVVGVCKEDNPGDVDEAYGAGTYARMFPSDDDEDQDEPSPRSSEGGHQWTEND